MIVDPVSLILYSKASSALSNTVDILLLKESSGSNSFEQLIDSDAIKIDSREIFIKFKELVIDVFIVFFEHTDLDEFIFNITLIKINKLATRFHVYRRSIHGHK